MVSSRLKSDVFVVVAWAATIFGLLEGVVLCISRVDPLIHAAHKVSTSILWVAPLVDLPLFLLVAVALFVGLRLAWKRLGTRSLLIAYGLFVFLGIYTVVSAPRKIQPIGAAVFSLGVAVAFCRKLKSSEERLTAYLRRRLVWMPLLIVAASLGVFGFQRFQEAWWVRSLPPAPAGATNVLIVVLDTVRADRFAGFAQSSLTPNLNQLAAEGVSLENAWSTTSWSLPSQASILTGHYPHEHGADWPSLRLGKKYPTLGGFLAARGYVTGAFSGNAAWVTPEYLGRGFLRFDVYQLEDLARRTVHGRKIDKLLEKVGYHSAGRGKKAPKLNAQFLRFLDDYRGRPFFAYLCYMDVNQAFHDRKLNHGDPKQVPAQAIIEAYDRALIVLDAQIGELFSELRRRGLLENTLVVVTSDHGESFGGDETNDHNPEGHGTSLYREQAAVPLFVIYPGKVPAGRRSSRSVSIYQIPATITRLLGLVDSPFPGEPLSVSWEQEGAPEQRNSSLLAELRDLDAKTIAQSVVNGHWQYIHHPNDMKQIRKGEALYDFAADPLEKENLAGAARSQSLVARMREDLQHLLSSGSEWKERVLETSLRSGEPRK